MKSFRVRFPKSIAFLSWAGVALCALVFGTMAWRCVNFDGFTDLLSSLQYIFVFIFSLFIALCLLLILYNSRYTVTETQLITSFAFFKSKYTIASFDKIVFDRKSCRIAVYTGENCFVLRLNEEWSREFIDLLLSRGNHILYDEAEEPDPTSEKKGKGQKPPRGKNDKKDQNDD